MPSYYCIRWRHSNGRHQALLRWTPRVIGYDTDERRGGATSMIVTVLMPPPTSSSRLDALHRDWVRLSTSVMLSDAV